MLSRNFFSQITKVTIFRFCLCCLEFLPGFFLRLVWSTPSPTLFLKYVIISFSECSIEVLFLSPEDSSLRLDILLMYLGVLIKDLAAVIKKMPPKKFFEGEFSSLFFSALRKQPINTLNSFKLNFISCKIIGDGMNIIIGKSARKARFLPFPCIFYCCW